MKVYKVKRAKGQEKPEVRISVGLCTRFFAASKSTWGTVPEQVVEKLLGLLPNAFMADVEMDTKGKEKEVSVEKILALQAQERKES